MPTTETPDLGWAVITGASRGIGRAIARRLSNDGYGIVAVGREIGPLLELVAEIEERGGKAVAFSVDLSDRTGTTIAKFGEQVRNSGFEVTVLVNNAGAASPGDFFDIDDAEWERTFQLNFLSPMSLVRALRPSMRRGETSVVNVGSILGTLPAIGVSPYATSKAALHHATRALAIELAPQYIRVNAVAPGFIATEMYEHGHPSERKAIIAKAHPLGRVGTEEEVAGAVSFLCSQDASFVTGAILPVDGGLSVASAVPSLLESDPGVEESA